MNDGMGVPPDSGGTFGDARVRRKRLDRVNSIATTCAGQADRFVRFLAGFAQEHAPESATRICMIMLCATGCYCAIRIMDFAMANPKEHLTIAALIGILTALIVSGCVAIALRTRSSDSAAAQAAAAVAADPPPAPAGRAE